jgi:deoxycytidine triphosphate deaminase
VGLVVHVEAVDVGVHGWLLIFVVCCQERPVTLSKLIAVLAIFFQDLD